MRFGASNCALGGLERFRARSSLGRLEKAARQPVPKAFAADWPGFPVTIYVHIGEAGAVGGVEKFGGLRQFDQDVGLGRSPPPGITSLLGDSLVKRRHPTAGFLQLGPQRLECGAVLLLQRSQLFQRIGGEGRAGIGGGLLDEPFQWIGNLFSRVDGSGDEVLGLDWIVDAHRVPPALPTSRSLKSMS